MSRLDGKVAIITGGVKGFWVSLCQTFCSRRCKSGDHGR